MMDFGEREEGLVADVRSRRRKLWELAPECHCPIVGACLPPAELVRIAARAGVEFRGNAGDYDVHVYFVRAAKAGTDRHKIVARLLQKALDRRHAKAVAAFRRAGTIEDLRSLWKQARDDGDFAGPLWAALTHPAASDGFLGEVYADAHMHSHRACAAGKAGARRLEDLEKALARAEEGGADEKARWRQRLERQDREIKNLRTRLAEERAARCRLESVAAPVSAAESSAEIKNLRAMVEELRRELATRTARLETAEGRLAEMKSDADRLRKGILRLQEALAGRTAECEALERDLHAQLGARGNGDVAGPSLPASDLGGRYVLYVGGHSPLVPQFRSLVERCNGCFLHHDGGKEEHGGRLADLLGRADVVLCPVDRVSHAACLKAKRHCKTCAKRFIALRSSGLSSFAKGLHDVADAAAPEPAAADGSGDTVPPQAGRLPIDGEPGSWYGG